MSSPNDAASDLLTFTSRDRKIITHQQLLSETITVLASSFKPEVTMIKQRLESLLDREYLARVEDAAVPSYRYVA